MTTQVVHINEPYDVYIGRAGYGLDGYFGNPFRADAKTPCRRCKRIHAKRSDTLPCYIDWFHDRILKDATFRRRVHELKDKRLACFCRPRAGFQGRLMCHGQIIAGYLDGIEPSDVP